MNNELRCEQKLHALVVDGFIEIKCDSRFCGAKPGIVVLHRFDPTTNELVKTLKFRDPNYSKRKEVNLGY